MRLLDGLRPAATLVALLAVGCGSTPSTCVVGQSLPCACRDGRSGAQICGSDHAFAACSCDTSCTPGTLSACGCSDGTIGAQSCQADGTFAVCNCSSPTMPGMPCIVGASAACTCTTGAPGAQVCQPDQAYGPCTCLPSGGDGGTTTLPLSTVLEFPQPSDTVATHVNHGKFWADNADLGLQFFWDAYVAPTGPGYLVSDGYGGAHALLWGPILSGRGQLVFQGDIWVGATSVSFAALEGSAPGEWGYHAIGLMPDLGTGNTYVYNFWNGIAVGMTPFGTVDRHSGNIGNGQGTLYVMGSSHQNLGGRLAALRVWDRASPLSGGNNPAAAFVPERTFTATLPSFAPANLLVDYTRPAVQIADLAPVGYDGGGTGAAVRHPGRLFNAPVGLVAPDQGFSSNLPSLGPLPVWVVDPFCPYGVAGPLPPNPGEKIPLPETPVSGALVFDSFGRRGQNFVWQQVPSLGMTEAGSLGPLAWKTGTLTAASVPAVFGIINGRAVFLERTGGIAWVDAKTADQDVRITRMTLITPTGIAFRVQDALNWWYATSPAQLGATAPSIQLGYVQNGVQHSLTSLDPGTSNWSTFRVVASGSNVTVFIDYGGSFVSIGTVAVGSVLQTATGAGMVGALGSVDATSMWRGDRFTICSVGGC